MKFGVLCNSNTFQQWQFESVRLLIESGHSCDLLIVNANSKVPQSFHHKLSNYPFKNLLCRAWFRYIIKPDAKQDVDITHFYKNITEIKCVTSRKGFSEFFESADIEKIKSYNLDFILRFGFGIIKGEILDAAKYGVWSYHHDDDRKYRGVPTGFWEIMFNDPVNAAILQRLTSKIDSGIILHKAYFSTIDHSWEANLNNLLTNSSEWPLQVCRKIENGDTEFLTLTNAPESAIYKLPENVKMLRFLIKLVKNKIRFHYRDLFLTEKWNVGMIPLPVEKLVQAGSHSLHEPVWLNIDSVKSIYHADPFGFVKDGKYYIICEEYNYKNAKGFLTCFQADAKTYLLSHKVTALEKDYHLAYPYLFEYKNTQYCIPENSAGGNLDLYRFDFGEGKLVFEQTLIKNLQAVDATLFFYDANWWLFFTDKTSTNERLHIWFSSNLRGPYEPHANNPVKVNIRSSRPAGKPFVVDGKLLRPAQDCSIRSGRRITVNQIIKLTQTDFYEIEYATLSPSATSKYRDGMHTFCVTDGAVIVDGKNEIFIWQAFVRRLTGKLKKFIKIKNNAKNKL